MSEQEMGLEGQEMELGLDEGAPEDALPQGKTTDYTNITGEEVSLEEPPAPDEEDPQERIIGGQDFLPVSFLEQGFIRQRAVARVVLKESHRGLPAGTGWATGFMVSPSLFMTNNHVIDSAPFASKIRIQFNYQLGTDGIEQTTTSYFPVVDAAFQTNPALDYTLIRMQPLDGKLPGDEWGFIRLNPFPRYRKGQHFNIIQHPRGRRKEIAIQDNEIHSLFQNTVRYEADTEPASSGSPVFNNLWEMVALHHAGGARDAAGTWLNNQGIRVDRIVADLKIRLAANPEIITELGID